MGKRELRSRCDAFRCIRGIPGGPGPQRHPPFSLHQLFLLQLPCYGPLEGFSQARAKLPAIPPHAEVTHCCLCISTLVAAGLSIDWPAKPRCAKRQPLDRLSPGVCMSFVRTGWNGADAAGTLRQPHAFLLSLRDNAGPNDGLLQCIVVRRMLASLATEESNDTSAIEHLSAVLDLMNHIGLPITINNRDGGGEPLSGGQILAPTRSPARPPSRQGPAPTRPL